MYCCAPFVCWAPKEARLWTLELQTVVRYWETDTVPLQEYLVLSVTESSSVPLGGILLFIQSPYIWFIQTLTIAVKYLYICNYKVLMKIKPI